MLKHFIQHIKTNQLNSEGTPLLAVSGGVDSVVMCDLYHRAGLDFAIAHCNFKLRGKISDEEKQFSAELAEKYGVTFHLMEFETEKIAEARGLSIQVAARDLRYAWFEELRVQEGYASIATAHHLNDVAETLLYNLTRGTGIRGLHGIPVRRGHIIRPLLFATKEAILTYANTQKLSWCEDASNALTKYSRNKIRLDVIPTLKEINPSFENTMQENVQRFQDTEALYQFALRHIKSTIFKQEKEQVRIDISKLHAYPAPATVLYELLKDFGFNQDQTMQIFKSLDGLSGARYQSATHELLRDRDALLIRQVSQLQTGAVYLNKEDREATFGQLRLQLQIVDKRDFVLDSASHIACFDFNQLVFPLQLRHWQAGDVFQPLGMNGRHKKVSDFLIDQKVSLFEKEQTAVLLSADKICWLVGHRVDERFKVRETTKVVLVVTLFSGR